MAGNSLSVFIASARPDGRLAALSCSGSCDQHVWLSQELGPSTPGPGSDRGLDLDLYLGLDLDLELHPDLDLVLDLGLNLSLDLHQDLDLRLDFHLDLDVVLDLGLDLGPDLHLDLEHRPGCGGGGGWNVMLWAGQSYALIGPSSQSGRALCADPRAAVPASSLTTTP